MQLQEKQVTLRKLVASEGKILVSKTLDEEGKPTVRSKEIYLADGASENDFEEIAEMLQKDEPKEVIETVDENIVNTDETIEDNTSVEEVVENTEESEEA